MFASQSTPSVPSDMSPNATIICAEVDGVTWSHLLCTSEIICIVGMLFLVEVYGLSRIVKKGYEKDLFFTFT
jgi:hypothetical protein